MILLIFDFREKSLTVIQVLVYSDGQGKNWQTEI